MKNWFSRSLRRLQHTNHWQATQLERRIMLDGSGDVANVDTVCEEIVEVSSLETGGSHAMIASANQIVFVDANVDDMETLQGGVVDGAEVVLLDGRSDAIAQITSTLASRRNVTAVHLVTHGQAGQLHFTNGRLDLEDLASRTSQLQRWSASLTPNADILVYGCDVAKGDKGAAFVRQLAKLTGADVAASVDKTGAESNAADWHLEESVGMIETPLAFSAASRQTFSDVLLVVDFENLTPGTQGSSFTDSGFQFTDGGWNSFDLHIFGPSQGYDSNVLHPQHYSRSVTIDRADGGAFSLTSFDYAAGRFGTTDASVTGTRSDGSTVSTSFDSDTKSLQTLSLDWSDLEQVVVDYRGGTNEVFGALDNFDFATTGEPTDAILSFASSSQSVNESAGNASFAVSRSGNTSASVTVSYATISGSATSGEDFGASAGTLTFAAGQTNATISIPLTDDAASESNETFSINLSSPSVGAVLGNASTTITIVDNDSTGSTETIDFEDLSIGLQGTSLTTQGFVFEDIGYGANQLRVYGPGAGYGDNVLHSDNWNRGIRLSKADGSSFDLESFDYGAGRWNTLTDADVVATFTDGSTDTRSFSTTTKTLNTLGLNWANLQSVEIDFRGGSTNAYGAVDNFQIGGGAPVTQPGTISLTVDQVTIDENSGSLNVIFFRGDGSDGPVSVDYTTVAGTAGSQDFQAVSGTMTFADGITGGQISIPILDDAVTESNESFSIVLSNPTGGATLGGIATQNVTIQDDDEITAGVIFEDSFEGSSVWVTNPEGTDTATTGMWEVASPQSTSSGGTTLQLNAGATGSRALVTGAAAGSSAGSFDIDNGPTSVMSPTIALPVGAEIELSFAYYLAYLDNATVDDYFEVAILANGVETEVYDDHGHNAVQEQHGKPGRLICRPTLASRLMSFLKPPTCWAEV